MTEDHKPLPSRAPVPWSRNHDPLQQRNGSALVACGKVDAGGLLKTNQMKTIERRQSTRTGDAIWMKFECGAGSRWTSTTEDSRGDVCNFSGCNCGTRVKFMGDTDNRDEDWFGLRKGRP